MAQIEQGMEKWQVPDVGLIEHMETHDLRGTVDSDPMDFDDPTGCLDFFQSSWPKATFQVYGEGGYAPGKIAAGWVFLFKDQETAANGLQAEIECIDNGCCHNHTEDVTRSNMKNVSGASYYQVSVRSPEGAYTDIGISYGNANATVRLMEEDGSGDFDPEEITRLFVEAMIYA